MKFMKIAAAILIVSAIFLGVKAEDAPPSGVEATPVPEVDAEHTQLPEAENDATEAPSIAEYRYLVCNPGSQVPLYDELSSGKPHTYLSRGTLVLVHEYSGGRARITFGG